MSLVLDDVGSGYNLSKINSNFQKLEDFANGGAISEDNNVMTTYLDMNSNRIVNVAEAENDNDAVSYSQVKYITEGLQSIDDNVQSTEDNANAASESAAEAAAAALQSVSDLKAAALAVGTTYDNITYSTNLVDEIKGYIFYADKQITYAVPEAAQGKFIQSVVDGVLITTDTSEYTLQSINRFYSNSVANARALPFHAGSTLDLDINGRVCSYKFNDSDLSLIVSPFISASPQILSGAYIVPDGETGLNGAWVRLIKNESVDLADFGVNTIDEWELSPICDFCEVVGLSLTGVDSSLVNPIKFTDTISVPHFQLGGDRPMHLKYVGADIDDLPVIRHGHSDIETASPARFASSKQYPVGDILLFSGGSFGDVLFTMGGYVYFKSHLDGNSFPSNGDTVTGVTSGFADTVSGVRDRIASANYDGVIKNVYLTTNLDLDVDSRPVSHTRATGILSSGVRGSRNFGRYKGQVIVQGFKRGVIVDYSWFFKADEITTNRCGDGVLLTDEVNACVIQSISTGGDGTLYDNVSRYSLRASYSYSLNIGLIGSENSVKVAPLSIQSCYGYHVGGGDIEGVSFSNPVYVSGSKMLDHVSDNKSTSSRALYSRGGSIPSIRFTDSLGILIDDYIDGLELTSWSWNLSSGSSISAAWANVISLISSSEFVTNVKVGGITSNALDFPAEFSKGVDLNRINLTNDCYNIDTCSFSVNKPASKASYLVSRKVFDSSRYMEVLSVNLAGESAMTGATMQVFTLENTKDAYVPSINTTDSFTAPDFGSYVNESVGLGVVQTKGFRIKPAALGATENFISFGIKFRYVNI